MITKAQLERWEKKVSRLLAAVGLPDEESPFFTVHERLSNLEEKMDTVFQILHEIRRKNDQTNPSGPA